MTDSTILVLEPGPYYDVMIRAGCLEEAIRSVCEKIASDRRRILSSQQVEVTRVDMLKNGSVLAFATGGDLNAVLVEIKTRLKDTTAAKAA